MTKEEKMQFNAETGKILQLMIHSLYTNKEIFLRELISNASDALDKLRYEAAKNENLLAENEELRIKINFNEEEKTLTIHDNGIGMNRQDLIDNLGTIARSGTQKFMENLTGDMKKDSQLIGQFGVGFYSSFMVSEEVEVKTSKASEKEVFHWKSKGDGEFTISELQDENFARGTEIKLFLKDEDKNFADQHRIEHIVKTYSDHVNFPIYLADGEEAINRSSALWMRSKSEISEEQYEEFFHHVAHDPGKPWMTIHNHNEGVIEFTNLLYVPETKPYDLFHPDRRSRVKLYVKRVFITDETVEMIPAYLRFLRGVIDSSDLPLNISRETLQANAVINKIKKSVTKKVISELKKKLTDDRESYLNFWKNFGAVLKEGLCEGIDESRENLLEICLFESAKTGEMISLQDYLDQMPEKQEEIFYISGDDSLKLKSSPQIEGFLEKGIDVLLFTDSVDNFWVNVAGYFKGKQMKSVTRSGIDLDKFDTEEKQNDKKDANETDEKVIELIKNVLAGKVQDVKKTSRLKDSPSCLTVADGSMDIQMERFLIEQQQLKSAAQKILEINLKHPIIRKIDNLFSQDAESEKAKNLVELIYDEACIIENEPLANPAEFAKRLNRVLEMI